MLNLAFISRWWSLCLLFAVRYCVDLSSQLTVGVYFVLGGFNYKQRVLPLIAYQWKLIVWFAYCNILSGINLIIIIFSFAKHYEIISELSLLIYLSLIFLCSFKWWLFYLFVDSADANICTSTAVVLYCCSLLHSSLVTMDRFKFPLHQNHRRHEGIIRP